MGVPLRLDARDGVPFDFGLALTPEQAQEIPEVNGMVDDPPEWLERRGRPMDTGCGGNVGDPDHTRALSALDSRSHDRADLEP